MIHRNKNLKRQSIQPTKLDEKIASTLKRIRYSNHTHIQQYIGTRTEKQSVQLTKLDEKIKEYIETYMLLKSHTHTTIYWNKN